MSRFVICARSRNSFTGGIFQGLIKLSEDVSNIFFWHPGQKFRPFDPDDLDPGYVFTLPLAAIQFYDTRQEALDALERIRELATAPGAQEFIGSALVVEITPSVDLVQLAKTWVNPSVSGNEGELYGGVHKGPVH